MAVWRRSLPEVLRVDEDYVGQVPRHEECYCSFKPLGPAEAGFYLGGQAGQFPEQVGVGGDGLVEMVVAVEVGGCLFHQAVEGVPDASDASGVEGTQEKGLLFREHPRVTYPCL